MQGILQVDAESFGISNALIRFLGVIDVRAEYAFDYLEDDKIWFPKNTNLLIKKGRSDRSISILGTTLDFEPESKAADRLNDRAIAQKRPKYASDFIYARSSTWFDTPEIDQPVTIRHNWVRAEISDNAIHQGEDFLGKLSSF